jgi:hypothetical protein
MFFFFFSYAYDQYKTHNPLTLQLAGDGSYEEYLTAFTNNNTVIQGTKVGTSVPIIKFNNGSGWPMRFNNQISGSTRGIFSLTGGKLTLKVLSFLVSSTTSSVNNPEDRTVIEVVCIMLCIYIYMDIYLYVYDMCLFIREERRY